MTCRRRIERLDQVQSSPQIPAGQLTRTGFHIDVAADAVKIKSERVDERLPEISVEQRALALHILLAAQERLLCLPTFIIDFTVD